MSRFLLNKSDLFLKKSIFNNMNNSFSAHEPFDQKKNVTMSYKRVIIFFIKSILNDKSLSNLTNRQRALQKLVKSSLFKLIIKPNKMRFENRSLIFNLFIRNYLSSK